MDCWYDVVSLWGLDGRVMIRMNWMDTWMNEEGCVYGTLDFISYKQTHSGLLTGDEFTVTVRSGKSWLFLQGYSSICRRGVGLQVECKTMRGNISLAGIDRAQGKRSKQRGPRQESI